jgi:hypothetical protein
MGRNVGRKKERKEGITQDSFYLGWVGARRVTGMKTTT